MNNKFIPFLQILFLCLLFNQPLCKAQSVISGIILNEKEFPIIYANVFIKNSIDGTTTDSLGKFIIKTKLKGNQLLNISFIGYEPILYPIYLEDKEYSLKISLKEITNMLDEIVISAGTIESNNDRKVAILRPIDIVTIAGASGDVINAIQSLPGVQRNEGDQTGLMVRGGDPGETLVLIDGIVSQNTFFSSVPGVSQRSRFNPFQFKGTSFSSGGYSSRYGQALSSILDLQTNDLPKESTVNVSLNLTGASLSSSKLMGNNAIEFSGSYLNLAPYLAITKNNFDYYCNPQGITLSTRWVSKVGETGMFKMYFYQNYNHKGITIPDPQDFSLNIDYGMSNENTFFYTSYSHVASEKLKFFTAFSFSNNSDNVSWGVYPIFNHDNRIQGRWESNFKILRKMNLISGFEFQQIGYEQVRIDSIFKKFIDIQVSGYIETEWKPKNWFSLKTGIRVEYSDLLTKEYLTPRISMALKTGESSQLSLAAGVFYQMADPKYLLDSYKPGFQQAIHYILNYQRIRNNRTFRIESYYKSYDQLIREINSVYNPNQYHFHFNAIDNSGYGYAKGIDFFWRDKESIQNLEYWISYSYVNTKRLYQDYIAMATPDFVSPHNLNIITKYFINPLQTNVSISYFYSSGRTYYNPNSTKFLSDKAPDYYNLSISLNYMTSLKKEFVVIFLGIDNLTNHHNILGYRFSTNGQEKYPIVSATNRTIFFGINISLTEFNKNEL